MDRVNALVGNGASFGFSSSCCKHIGNANCASPGGHCSNDACADDGRVYCGKSDCAGSNEATACSMTLRSCRTQVVHLNNAVGQSVSLAPTAACSGLKDWHQKLDRDATPECSAIITKQTDCSVCSRWQLMGFDCARTCCYLGHDAPSASPTGIPSISETPTVAPTNSSTIGDCPGGF